MKVTTIPPLLAVMLLLFSCTKQKVEPCLIVPEKDEISFTGTWERQFEAGPGNLHVANYYIYQDSIRYKLAGAIGNADYTMYRDTFLLDDYRFVGHTSGNLFYVIFFKNISEDSITVYKQTVANIADGLSLAIPSDTTTQNHGWNTFYQ